ncbi:MAG: HNH endonuclease [Sulfuricurvum sp.]|uniref:HNH endonuclease n=1 Tax=Sulfuricurvum sp. TaxID=2025608 RepID=UPI0025CCA188|nr:HNH endonuclease [Sulfuricurvum sp.]MBV5321955.1 HNH endonuclease [Sulfuricurvum sp.]
MAKNWEYTAGIIWPFLVRAAINRDKLTYSDLAPIIKTNPLSVGKALEPIQDYCIDYKLPPLTSIVVGKTTGIPGGGFIAWDVNDIETAYEKVFSHPWQLVENPFEGFYKNDSTDSLADEIIENPKKAEAIYQRVKVRGTAQAIFRSALLKAYENKCAICGFSFTEALEAAHIVPWSKSNNAERISPNNGILLCSNHHKLFDSEIIKINSEFKILHNNNEKKKYSKVDKMVTIEMNLKTIQLPRQKKLHPSIDLINKRNNKNAY